MSSTTAHPERVVLATCSGSRSGLEKEKSRTRLDSSSSSKPESESGEDEDSDSSSNSLQKSPSGPTGGRDFSLKIWSLI